MGAGIRSDLLRRRLRYRLNKVARELQDAGVIVKRDKSGGISGTNIAGASYVYDYAVLRASNAEVFAYPFAYIRPVGPSPEKSLIAWELYKNHGDALGSEEAGLARIKAEFRA